MGIFDKLAKKGLAGLKGKLEEAAGIDLDGDGSVGNGNAVRTQPDTYRESAPRASTQSAPKQDIVSYFEGILAGDFSSYTVKKGASAGELGFGASMPAKAYDFALMQGTVCRAVIMLTPHNRDNNAAFRNARQAAANSGVPFINFYTHFPNEKSYVVSRINSFIG